MVEGYDGPQPAGSAEAPPAGKRKGYWIAHADVKDAEAYKTYGAAVGAPLGKYGGRFLVRGGACEVVEGQVRSRTVVVEFPSYDAARACYHSPDYQTVAALRKGKADFDLFIIEGSDGEQA
ncbi:MAG: DUF1330 domain-containing protein [Hyphomicrobiales bacterium]|nr:DUF1330 domain-containing protein [Hyphomicrobiales bacterium]